MKALVIVGFGGFLGAISRYLLAGWVQQLSNSNFPFGTLSVNSIGSFILGLLAGLFQHSIISPELRLLLTIGFLGAFTTFSTFSYETLMLLKNGAIAGALINIFINLVLGLIFVYFGFVLGQAL